MFEKFTNEDGASAVEYGLLIAVIAIAVAAAAALLGPTVSAQFTNADTCIQNPSAANC